MTRKAEITLTDGDGVSLTVWSRPDIDGVGLWVKNGVGGPESYEVCLSAAQRRQLLHFLAEAEREAAFAAGCTAGGDCPVHPYARSIHEPSTATLRTEATA